MNYSQKPARPISEANYTDLSYLISHYPSLVEQAQAPALEFMTDPDTILCARSLLQNEGFVILKNVIKKKYVLDARDVVLTYLSSEGKLTDEGTISDHNSKGMLLTGFKQLTHTPEMLAVTESPALFKALTLLIKGEASTFDTKWLRVKGKDEFTEIHSDFFRFETVAKQASGPFLVAWIPLCEAILPSQGGLSLLHKSHHNFDFSGQYLDTELPGNFPGSLEDMSEKQVWSTNQYEAGDVVIFDIKTVHTSFRNRGEHFRISVDTRWMLKQDLKYL